jgi:hypothetical protein
MTAITPLYNRAYSASVPIRLVNLLESVFSSRESRVRSSVSERYCSAISKSLLSKEKSGCCAAKYRIISLRPLMAYASGKGQRNNSSRRGLPSPRKRLVKDLVNGLSPLLAENTQVFQCLLIRGKMHIEYYFRLRLMSNTAPNTSNKAGRIPKKSHFRVSSPDELRLIWVSFEGGRLESMGKAP